MLMRMLSTVCGDGLDIPRAVSRAMITARRHGRAHVTAGHLIFLGLRGSPSCCFRLMAGTSGCSPT